MNCMLRKFLLKQINKILEEKKDSIEACKAVVSIWETRAQLILDSVKSLRTKLEDNKLDSDEIEAFVNEIKKTVESW